MNKKIKLSLGVAATLTAIATPIATTISCGKKKAKPETTKDKNVETKSVEQVNAVVNLDKIFENAKKKSTDLNVANKLVKEVNGAKYFDTKSTKYVDPLYYAVSDILKELMTSMSKDAPKIKPLLGKLTKNNNFYKITEDIVGGVIDGKLLAFDKQDKELHDKDIKDNKKNPHKIKRASLRDLLNPNRQGGLLTLGLALMNDTDSFQELVGMLITSVWDKSKADFEKVGITVGEFTSFLKQINNSKITVSIIINGKTINLLKDMRIKLPSIIWSILKETDKTSLTKKLDSLMSVIKPFLISKMPKKPIGKFIMDLLDSKSKKTPAKNIYSNNNNQPGLGSILSLLSSPALTKIQIMLGKIMSGNLTPLDPKMKLSQKEINDLMTKLPLSENIKKFATPVISILTKIAELYQVK
ncbi:hypothetical protein [Mycoplasma todarodis]|uniref:Lipoprotein n=1 Tax=Mycoplasma todarodis TaxID=1937191 RepID=A0A4V2NI82_9MOLU|nr:hypothetical protein [Mycoplasma todarodis]TCG11812.1 hypothetical protein C4B25_00645 [Mycoplasma todarodis]